jgi:hypothetical protein
MKGKIDKNGLLQIERAGKLKGQFCPWTDTENNPSSCGDWCPLFHEGNLISKPGKETIFIDLCRRQIVFTEFADERPRP